MQTMEELLRTLTSSAAFNPQAGLRDPASFEGSRRGQIHQGGGGAGYAAPVSDPSSETLEDLYEILELRLDEKELLEESLMLAEEIRKTTQEYMEVGEHIQTVASKNAAIIRLFGSESPDPSLAETLDQATRTIKSLDVHLDIMTCVGTATAKLLSEMEDVHPEVLHNIWSAYKKMTDATHLSSSASLSSSSSGQDLGPPGEHDEEAAIPDEPTGDAEAEGTEPRRRNRKNVNGSVRAHRRRVRKRQEAALAQARLLAATHVEDSPANPSSSSSSSFVRTEVIHEDQVSNFCSPNAWAWRAAEW